VHETLAGKACDDTAITPIGPIEGRVPGVDERGAIALYCRQPAHWPFDVRHATYTVVWQLPPCGLVDHAFIAFPSASPPAYVTGTARVVPVSTAGWDMGGPGQQLKDVTVDFDPPIRLEHGQSICGGARLDVAPDGGRTCVTSCDKMPPDPDSFYSALVPSTGKIDKCPETCDFLPLYTSPDAATAKDYGNDQRRFDVTYEGTVAE
jgi:hypothetical protein